MKQLFKLLALFVALFTLSNCSKSIDPVDEVDDIVYWKEANVPVKEDLRDIFFVNENVGWATGNNSTILKTVDGGKTWAKQTYGDFANFSDVYFINENTGWIAGTAGTLIHTVNGGSTWTKLPTVTVGGAFWSLSEVHFIDENIGWIVGNTNAGEADVVIKTENGGTSWSIMLDKVPTQLNAIEVINSDQIYVAGGGFSSRAKLYYTADAGKNWTELTIGSEEYSVADIACQSSTIILVCPYMNGGYRSEDKGVSFTMDANYGYTSRVIMEDGIVWTCGSSVKFSTDGGTKWTSTTEKNSNYINNGDGLSGFFAINKKAWAITQNGKIFYYL